MNTYSAKPTDVTRKWYVIDASEAPLGRVSSSTTNWVPGRVSIIVPVNSITCLLAAIDIT